MRRIFTRLNIEHSDINDAGLALLKPLTKLQYLNLVATKVTVKGIEQLKDLPVLENIYLGQTQIQKSEWPGLLKLFPKTKLDSGGYQVQYLATDTMLVKAPVVQK